MLDLEHTIASKHQGNTEKRTQNGLQQRTKARTRMDIWKSTFFSLFVASERVDIFRSGRKRTLRRVELTTTEYLRGGSEQTGSVI